MFRQVKMSSVKNSFVIQIIHICSQIKLKMKFQRLVAIITSSFPWITKKSWTKPECYNKKLQLQIKTFFQQSNMNKIKTIWKMTVVQNDVPLLFHSMFKKILKILTWRTKFRHYPKSKVRTHRDIILSIHKKGTVQKSKFNRKTDFYLADRNDLRRSVY